MWKLFFLWTLKAERTPQSSHLSLPSLPQTSGEQGCPAFSLCPLTAFAALRILLSAGILSGHKEESSPWISPPANFPSLGAPRWACQQCSAPGEKCGWKSSPIFMDSYVIQGKMALGWLRYPWGVPALPALASEWEVWLYQVLALSQCPALLPLNWDGRSTRKHTPG